MDDIPSPPLVHDPETRRALQLDTLAAILPMEHRDRLAELLTDDDVGDAEASGAGRDGRKHAAGAGVGPCLSRSLGRRCDRRRPALARVGRPRAEIPGAPSLGSSRAGDGPTARHPESVAAALRQAELFAPTDPSPSTVKRRLSSWGTLHRWKGLGGPFSSPGLRSALRLAVRATMSGRGNARASAL